MSDSSAAFVDIWLGPLPVDSAWLPELRACLSDREQQRANQFKTSELQQRFCTSRGLMRHVLGHYLDQAAASLTIEQDAHGKPHLHPPVLSFNLSHTANQIALAISNLPSVGIDTEAIKPRRDLAGLAQHCLSQPELQQWQTWDAGRQLIDFYRLWTIKEAFVKACGRGLAAGLRQCEIDTLGFKRFLALPDACSNGLDWSIAYSTVGFEHALAVVTPQVVNQCRFRSFAELALG